MCLKLMRSTVLILALFLGAGISHVYAQSPGKKWVVMKPTSAWLVAESRVISDGERLTQKVPCTMLNQYNNGYLFRFNGTNDKLLVFAIDFRNSIFTPGQFYKMHVKVSPDYSEEVFAKAFNTSTIIINMEEELKGFLPKLKDNQFLRLQFRQKKQDFALTGIEKGMKRMADCYNKIDVADTFNMQRPENTAPKDTTRERQTNE